MPHTKRHDSDVSPRKSPGQTRSKQTVEAILEGAAQVLELRGYLEATTERIAERAGVSVGTLYQYFPNKDSILLTLCRCHGMEAMAMLEPSLRQLLADPPELHVGLQVFVDTCMRLNGRRPRLHQVLFEETPFPEEVLREMRRSGKLLLDATAEYIRRAPGAHVESPRLAAYLVLRTLGSVFGGMVLERPKELELTDCAAELVHLLESYLSRAAIRRPADTLDLCSRFVVYSEDFERCYADGNWNGLAHHFHEHAVYECREPTDLGFRVEGRAAVLEQFRSVSERFDRSFDSREMRLSVPRQSGTSVTVTGAAIYRIAGAPPLRLEFEERAEFRGHEIVHLEDRSPPHVVEAARTWMAEHRHR